MDLNASLDENGQFVQTVTAIRNFPEGYETKEVNTRVRKLDFRFSDRKIPLR
jgi:hypothetical protein